MLICSAVFTGLVWLSTVRARAVLSVLIGIGLGNRIRAARYRRAVDIGYRDGFHVGRITAPASRRKRSSSAGIGRSNP